MSKDAGIPAAAWSRPLGEGYEPAPRPRVDQPLIDDGPWAGAPIGGMGAGSIGRTQRGDFARWHLDVGTHRFESIAASQFSLFHFFFAWNDFFTPLLYLAGKRDLQPLSVGIQQYNELYSTQPTLIQAAAIMTMAVPVVIFFLAQRFYMQGVVATGVEK